MEPSFITLKQEMPPEWPMNHVSLVNLSPQSPRPTHKRLPPKRSISFASTGSGHSFTPTLEPNSLDLKAEWANESIENMNPSFGAHPQVLQQQQAHYENLELNPFQSWVQNSNYEMEVPVDGAKSENSSYELLPDLPKQEFHQHLHHTRVKMESFPPEEVTDFKHVVYNLLVEYHNEPSGVHLVEPCTLMENNRARYGFRFNEVCNPEKRLPELYVQHLKNAQLEHENQNSPLIQDLYKFYMRSCVELLSKYFEKIDKYTYLYEDSDNPLFIPNGNLLDAEVRIKNMKTRTRKKKAGSKKEHIVPNTMLLAPPGVRVPPRSSPSSGNGRKKVAPFSGNFDTTQPME